MEYSAFFSTKAAVFIYFVGAEEQNDSQLCISFLTLTVSGGLLRAGRGALKALLTLILLEENKIKSYH